MGEYLKHWGFALKKPLKRAYEKNPESVKKWMTEAYPDIAERAKKESTEIHWAMELFFTATLKMASVYAERQDADDSEYKPTN